MTFLEKQLDPTASLHWLGDMQADYLYTNGVAGDKFFKNLMKNGKFLASQCPKCKKVLFPPKLYCEECFFEIPDNNWFEVPATGKIRLHTLVTIDTFGEKLEKPKVIGLIDIDDTDGAILGIIYTNKIEENLIGKKVEAVFKAKNKREGTLRDILYFQERK
jgi:uncharacterized OB-fold protein